MADEHQPEAAGPEQVDEPVAELDAEWSWPEDRHTALPPKVESWRRRSATGAILTGFALGLQEALEKKREEPSIVMETSGQPPTDLPVEAELEQRPARHSVVKIRPWLLAEGSTGQRGGEAPTEAPPEDR